MITSSYMLQPACSLKLSIITMWRTAQGLSAWSLFLGTSIVGDVLDFAGRSCWCSCHFYGAYQKVVLLLWATMFCNFICKVFWVAWNEVLLGLCPCGSSRSTASKARGSKFVLELGVNSFQNDCSAPLFSLILAVDFMIEAVNCNMWELKNMTRGSEMLVIKSCSNEVQLLKNNRLFKTTCQSFNWSSNDQVNSILVLFDQSLPIQLHSPLSIVPWKIYVLHIQRII